MSKHGFDDRFLTEFLIRFITIRFTAVAILGLLDGTKEHQTKFLNIAALIKNINSKVHLFETLHVFR